ncbi:HipA family kinase [Brevibacillus fulvus]|uniref:HipA-like kinase domain-containing protein n=1 Tax=Brevibacillus fulvus TaxID=1125967 RepID=A0A938Y0Q1_9BACL|nr:HipA family kinase [Brevibacillus fulvus]MBM7589437.1 hypothetical protein [Brevibacillus fulvus]
MSEWNCQKVWRKRPHSHVWLVENQEGERGYFKFATQRQWFHAGPMIVNEFVAAYLAKHLGFPVADMEPATIMSPTGKIRHGFVSVRANAERVVRWDKAHPKVRRSPERYVNHLDLLRQLVVFDAWILNTDRAGRNLILYRDHDSSKYNWYLIDHGHSLYGPAKRWKQYPWNHPHWRRARRFFYYSGGYPRLTVTKSDLEPMIAKIEQLDSSVIDEALDTVPEEYLSPSIRSFIRDLLLYRQKRIRHMMLRWLRYKKKIALRKRKAKSAEPALPNKSLTEKKSPS